MIRLAFTLGAARRCAAALSACLLFSAALSAQSPDSQSASRTGKAPKASRTAGWRVEVESNAAAEYDNNIFLLSPTQRASVASPSAGATSSGRYQGMESASDVIGVGSIATRLHGPGARGRTLEITPEISYEFASRNRLRREAAGALSVAQSLGGGRRIRLKAGSTPSHFSRNYLSDAVDADANGSISSGERIYRRGQYGEYSIVGDLRLPLAANSSKSAPIVLAAGGGYYARSYDAPFAVRDLSGPTASVSLDIGQKSPVELELTYDLAVLSAATGVQQVVLLDEPVYSVDFNGNGTTTDLSARAAVEIDRSRLEHQIGGTLVFDTGRRVDASLGFDYRIRSFRSTLPYDEDNAGRRDNRSGIRGSLRAKMKKGVYLSTGVKFLTQSTNRPLGSTVGEETDYKKIGASVGLNASF